MEDNIQIKAPSPVDNKLIAMLKGAKKIMKKVEGGDYSTGHINRDALTETGIKKLHESGVVRPQKQEIENISDEDYEERVHKSGLPDIVKKAMLEKRIEQPTMGAFSLKDVKELIDEEEEEREFIHTTKANPTRVITKSSINESKTNNNEPLGIGRNELKGMIKDIILEVLSTEYNKTLTENTIKQTINTLIKEGKLTIKKKV